MHSAAVPLLLAFACGVVVLQTCAVLPAAPAAATAGAAAAWAAIVVAQARGRMARDLAATLACVAAFAAGQRHHQHAVALVGVAGHGGGALAGLVVRVGMHRHQPQFAQPVPSHLLTWCGHSRDVSTVRVAL